MDEEELRQIVREEVEKQIEEENTATNIQLGENRELTRRKFLKTLGLGAGGLALSSTAAADWTLLGSGSSGGGFDISQGRGPLGLPTHHIRYASGLNNEEIARFTLQAADALELWRLELAQKGGGTNSNVSLDVYDATNDTVLGSVTAGNTVEGGSNPLGTSGTGATILIRLTTNTTDINLCPTAITAVVEG